MKTFSSPKMFAAHLVKLAAISEEVLAHATKKSAEEIRDTAQGMIGQYQDAIGPYAKWEELADSTEAEKARLGFSLDAPLLRTGEMKKSIQETTEGKKAVVGSKDKNMVYHELGTLHIPPRPVLGPAVMHSKERVGKFIGKTTVAWLCGVGWRQPRKISAS